MTNLSKNRAADVYVWKGKAYIPSKGVYKGGLRVSMDPVRTVELDVREIVVAVSAVLAFEPPQLPVMPPEERKRLLETIPRATGARSWNQLYKEAYPYVIELTEDGFRLHIPDDGTRQGWIFPQKKIFPPGTEITIIVQELLNDYRSRNKTDG
jgi:hypothetical protein